MVQTFDGGGTLAIGAVTAGVAAGGIAACVRLPFPVVLICASAVTAVYVCCKSPLLDGGKDNRTIMSTETEGIR